MSAELQQESKALIPQRRPLDRQILERLHRCSALDPIEIRTDVLDHREGLEGQLGQ